MTLTKSEPDVLNGLTPTQWLDKAQMLVDELSDASDDVWRQFESVVDRAANWAHGRMVRLIGSLPEHTDPSLQKMGFVDFSSTVGRQRQRWFLRQLSKIYHAFGLEIHAAMGHRPWPNSAPWDRSLGLVQHSVPRTSLLQTYRDYSERFLQGLQALYHSNTMTEELHSQDLVVARRLGFVELVEGKKWRLPKIKAGGIRRGLRDALKGSTDQEKAFLENVLRGLDDLRSKHANRIFDAGTGNVHKKTLLDIANDYKAGNLSKNQMKLSVQTHLRAMARRQAGWFFENMRDAEVFVQVPPGHPRHSTPSVRERAYQMLSPSKVARNQSGSHDSLGAFPGDRVVSLPLTRNMARALRQELEKRVEAYQKKVDAARARAIR